MKPGPTDRPLLYLLVFVNLALLVAVPIGVYSLKIIEPFTFAFYRFILSSVVLLLLVKFRNHAIPIERKDYARCAGNYGDPLS